MKILSFGAKLASKFYSRRFRSWEKESVVLQQKVFNSLIEKGKDTSFGEEHNFAGINNYDDFKKHVPIRDYESYKHYIERIIQGEEKVLWPAKTLYFAKSSGTTSGTKYLPISSDSIHNHVNCARLGLLMYVHKTGNTDFLKGKLMFVSGSPKLEKTGGILTGRLSGISNHHVPGFLKKIQLPSYETNCIEHWEEKLDKIIKETKDQNLTFISGIPSWVEMYFDRLLKKTGKQSVSEIFPGLSLYMHGGVNFKPYETRFQQLIGKDIDTMDTYPSSEGFIGFQDEFPGEGMILIPDEGIFFEFIPVKDFDKPDAPRLSLEEVETGVNYVVIINNNAGIWGYNLGDTVRFISTNPYRLIVTGRIKHYISAFGEHVIAEEVESAIAEACQKTGAEIKEFTVAPLVNNPEGRPCHEWFVEFSKKPSSLEDFKNILDKYVQEKNNYYRELVEGNVLQPLLLKPVKRNSFMEYMKSIGKLGGQNKTPHLKNDRSVAEFLQDYLE